jgi:hypothetical protein
MATKIKWTQLKNPNNLLHDPQPTFFTLFKVFPFLTYLFFIKLTQITQAKLVCLKLHPSKMTLHKTTCQFKLVMKWAKKLFPNLAHMHGLFLIGIMNKQKHPTRNWWFFVGYFMTIANTLNFKNNNQNYTFLLLSFFKHT